jgi:hypothetical protein
MIDKYHVHSATLALALFLATLLTGRGAVEPQPGEVFREFTFNYGASPSQNFAELEALTDQSLT